MSDPFKEPDVQVVITWRQGGTTNCFTVEQPHAADIAGHFLGTRVGAYKVAMKHRAGVFVFDMDEVAGIQVMSGTADRVKELVDLIC